MRRRLQSAALFLCMVLFLALSAGSPGGSARQAEAASDASAEDFYGCWESSVMDFIICIYSDGTYECYDSDGFCYDGYYNMRNGELATDDDVRYYLDGEGGMRDNLDDILYPSDLSVYSPESHSDSGSSSSSSFLGTLYGIEFQLRFGSDGEYTAMYVKSDCTFSGYYIDTQLGNTSEEYPGGTVYYQSFYGEFTEPVQLDEYTYCVQIASIDNNYEVDSIEFENATRYIYTESFGFLDGEDYYFYMQGTPVEDLPDEYISSVANTDYNDNGTLAYCGFYNVNTGQGFYSFDPYVDGDGIWNDSGSSDTAAASDSGSTDTAAQADSGSTDTAAQTASGSSDTASQTSGSGSSSGGSVDDSYVGNWYLYGNTSLESVIISSDGSWEIRNQSGGSAAVGGYSVMSAFGMLQIYEHNGTEVGFVERSGEQLNLVLTTNYQYLFSDYQGDLYFYR